MQQFILLADEHISSRISELICPMPADTAQSADTLPPLTNPPSSSGIGRFPRLNEVCLLDTFRMRLSRRSLKMASDQLLFND